MSHILVAIATPLAARHMAAPLDDLAHRLNASVTLLHVPRGGGTHPSATLAAERADVAQLSEKLSTGGVDCRTVHSHSVDDLPGMILKAAAEAGASLIMMGISGKSAFARKAGGDIPSQLLSRTTLPVLLIPPAAADTL